MGILLMGDNTFIKIITLADLDKALNDTVIYERVKSTLSTLLKNDVLDVTSIKLVEDKTLNQALCKLLKDALKCEESYKDLYKGLDDKQLVDKLMADALHNAYNAWFSRVGDDKVKLHTTILEEALKRNNIDYYLEVSKVLDWCSFEYCHCADSTKEFIKKHIDAIVESNNPNKTLERLQLFHLYQLHLSQFHNKEALLQLQELQELQKDTDRFKEFLDASLEHLEAFEHLFCNSLSRKLWCGHTRIESIALDNLNRKNISAFIKNPVLSSLKIVAEPSEPINFFTFVSALWWALINGNNVTTAFEETQNKYKEYKAYQKELSQSIKKYQQIYKSGLDELALKILDQKGAVKDEIDFKALANDLCALSDLYHIGIPLAKKIPIMDKFFEKFDDSNTVCSIVKGQLDVLSWIYKGFYGNMNNAEKEFMQQHLDKIMDCNRPREALNALYFIYFYKLHNKTNTNDIIDAVLKNDSPESFFKEFIKRLASMNEYPHSLKEDKINSVLSILEEVLLTRSTTSNEEAVKTKTPIQNGQITANKYSFYAFKYAFKGYCSLRTDANKPDTPEHGKACHPHLAPLVRLVRCV